MRFCTGCGASLAAPVSRPAAAQPAIHATPAVTALAREPGTPATQPSNRANLRLTLIASASGLVSVVGFLAGLTNLLPSGISSIIVLVGVTVGLRVLWIYAARSASSSSRARTMQIVSNVGLGISALSIIVGLPRITRAAGVQTFLVDTFAQLWTMAILTLVASHTRTFNWRVLVSAGLTGFLAIISLARLVGVPVIESLGHTSLLAVALWVPLTEELFKLIPVLIVLFVALRHAHARPSAMDLTLLGAWTGAGFALCENASLGRGSFSLTGAPLVSLILPSVGSGRAFGWPLVQTGHLCHTALIALSLALALLYYRKNKRLRWAVPLIAIGVTLLEHGSQNGMAVGSLNETVGKIAMILTLGGWLSPLLLIAGVGFVILLERRILGGAFRPAELANLSPAEALRRSTLLARAQTGGVA
jgi:RsiW-degrading membrane proteinase PrsW (M82 family)